MYPFDDLNNSDGSGMSALLHYLGIQGVLQHQTSVSQVVNTDRESSEVIRHYPSGRPIVRVDKEGTTMLLIVVLTACGFKELLILS